MAVYFSIEYTIKMCDIDCVLSLLNSIQGIYSTITVRWRKLLLSVSHSYKYKFPWRLTCVMGIFMLLLKTLELSPNIYTLWKFNQILIYQPAFHFRSLAVESFIRNMKPCHMPNDVAASFWRRNDVIIVRYYCIIGPLGSHHFTSLDYLIHHSAGALFTNMV